MLGATIGSGFIPGHVESRKDETKTIIFKTEAAKVVSIDWVGGGVVY